MWWAWRKEEGGRRETAWELKQVEEGYVQGALSDAWALIRVTVRYCTQPQAQRDLAEKGRNQYIWSWPGLDF